MSERTILAETNTPDGVRVVLFEDTWLLHILNPDDGHTELEPHRQAVLDAIDSPDHQNQSAGPAIEGEESSLDKQTYGSVLADRHSDLVLVPLGGKHVVESFDTVYEAVLNRTLWSVEFFLLCDGDSAPPQSGTSEQAFTEGRLRRLSRYHLENYFLDEQRSSTFSTR